MRFKLPLAIFLLLAVLLAVGLGRDPAPPALGAGRQGGAGHRPAAAGGPAAPPADRQPARPGLAAQRVGLLVRALPRGAAGAAGRRAPRRRPLYGLNYKDRDEAALTMLRRHGNPYRASAVDGDGRVGIDYWVYGVPETFVIDREGRIRLRHPGPVTPEIWQNELMPLVRSLQ